MKLLPKIVKLNCNKCAKENASKERGKWKFLQKNSNPISGVDVQVVNFPFPLRFI